MVGVVLRCRWSWLIVGVGLDQEPDLYQMDGRHVELWRLLSTAKLRHWVLGQRIQMLCFVKYGIEHSSAEGTRACCRGCLYSQFANCKRLPWATMLPERSTAAWTCKPSSLPGSFFGFEAG